LSDIIKQHQGTLLDSLLPWPRVPLCCFIMSVSRGEVPTNCEASRVPPLQLMLGSVPLRRHTWCEYPRGLRSLLLGPRVILWRAYLWWGMEGCIAVCGRSPYTATCDSSWVSFPRCLNLLIVPAVCFSFLVHPCNGSNACLHKL
jgi:hypothetical protein